MSDETKYFDPPLTEHMIVLRKRGWNYDELGKCTCTGCHNERTCLYSYDTYNSNDDCLADK